MEDQAKVIHEKTIRCDVIEELRNDQLRGIVELWWSVRETKSWERQFELVFDRFFFCRPDFISPEQDLGVTSFSSPVSLSLFRQGSISPNFFRQAAICRCTAFGENFTVQFHHHTHPNCTEICPIFWAEIRRASAQFAESVRRSLSPIRQKGFSSCARKKVGLKCWWNWHQVFWRLRKNLRSLRRGTPKADVYPPPPPQKWYLKMT